eukprot:6464613-Amphidinium_carterae.2
MVDDRIRSLRPHDAALAHGLGQRRALPRHAAFPASQSSTASTVTPLVADGPPQPLSWHAAQQLASEHIGTYRHLPPKCRSEIGLLVQNLLNTPQGAHRTHLEGPDYLLVLPKLVWPVNKARRKLTPHQRHTEIAARLRLAAAGHWQELHRLTMEPTAHAAALPAALPPHEAEPREGAPALPLTATQAQRLHSAVLAGAGLRAWRCLHSLPLAPATDSSWQEACALLQPCQASALCTPPAPQAAHRPRITFAQLQPVLSGLHWGKGTDPGGWYHETVQQVCDNCQVADALCTWLTHLAYDPLQEAELALYTTHRLVMLQKANGRIRPLLLSGVFKKMVSAIHARPLLEHFEPTLRHYQYTGPGAQTARLSRLVLQAGTWVPESTGGCQVTGSAICTMKRHRQERFWASIHHRWWGQLRAICTGRTRGEPGGGRGGRASCELGCGHNGG